MTWYGAAVVVNVSLWVLELGALMVLAGVPA